MDHVRAKDRHELSFAVGIRALLCGRAAMGAPPVARVHRRLAHETMQFRTLIGGRMSNETPSRLLGTRGLMDCDVPGLTDKPPLRVVSGRNAAWCYAWRWNSTCRIRLLIFFEMI